VDSADIIKGYKVGKGEYIELDPEELEAVAIESKRTIEIDEFVPKDEIDELYVNNPYYIAPDGDSRPEPEQRVGRSRGSHGDFDGETRTPCFGVSIAPSLRLRRHGTNFGRRFPNGIRRIYASTSIETRGSRFAGRSARVK
jgi:Ku70/Ku80 beta-barrel domain